MKRFALFAAGLGVLVAGIVLQPGAAQGQVGKSSGLRLNLVGIAVSDYAKSQAFYERVMGFPVAFKFSSPDGTRTNTFFQMSRDSFLEMQQATADVRARPHACSFRRRRSERHAREAAPGGLAGSAAEWPACERRDRGWLLSRISS